MKKIVTAIIALFTCIVVISLYQILFSVHYIYWSDTDIYFVGIKDSRCYETTIDPAEGVMFKFKYEIEKKFPLSNALAFRVRFKNQHITQINVTLRDNEGNGYLINDYLHNYLYQELFRKLITDGLINPYVSSGLIIDSTGGKLLYDYIQPYEVMIDNLTSIDQIDDSLCHLDELMGTHICDELKSFGDIKILKELDTLSWSNTHGLFCPVIMAESPYVEESYVGNLNLFIKLYNDGYVGSDLTYLYSGFLMKLTLPDTLKGKSWKDIEAEIHFSDGEIMSAKTTISGSETLQANIKP